MPRAIANPVVHLELLTDNLPRACAFYTRLFGWRADTVHAGSGTYLALALGAGVRGGVVEREGERPLWLPYVEVADIDAATERAPARGVGDARSPRGPGRLAQRARRSRGRRDSAVAAEGESAPVGASRSSSRSPRAAPGPRRWRFAASSSRNSLWHNNLLGRTF
jgi:predicted enzyme related to lactoylglutathione lyase